MTIKILSKLKKQGCRILVIDQSSFDKAGNLVVEGHLGKQESLDPHQVL